MGLFKELYVLLPSGKLGIVHCLMAVHTWNFPQNATALMNILIQFLRPVGDEDSDFHLCSCFVYFKSVYRQKLPELEQYLYFAGLSVLFSKLLKKKSSSWLQENIDLILFSHIKCPWTNWKNWWQIMILFPYESRTEQSAWGWDLWMPVRPNPLPVSHIKFLKYPFLKNKNWKRSDIGVLIFWFWRRRQTSENGSD